MSQDHIFKGMEYFDRFIEKRILRLFDHFPVVVVTGARQVGKTTMVEHLFQNSIKTITFDPVVDIGNAREDPDYFIQNNPSPVFLDEIQYAPELLGSIKRKIDKSKKPGQYILSGSQNLAVLKNISESLAGRAAILNLMCMSYREKKKSLNRNSFLISLLQKRNAWKNIFSNPPAPDSFAQNAFTGGFPGAVKLPRDLISDYWSSYMQTYIERDVRRVANIENLQKFGRFIRLLAALSGCEINHNHLGRELDIDRNTAFKWNEIARATYQWYTIPPFSRNPVKKIAGKAKGYFADTGFLCYLLSINSPDSILSHPSHGRIFETSVFLEIKKTCMEMGIRESMYHFRTYSGAEIDCIIETNGLLYLIEIKATTQPKKKHTESFKSFRSYFPNEKIGGELIICAVEQPLRITENCIAVGWWMI